MKSPERFGTSNRGPEALSELETGQEKGSGGGKGEVTPEGLFAARQAATAALGNLTLTISQLETISPELLHTRLQRIAGQLDTVIDGLK